MSDALLIVDDELDAVEGARFYFESRGVPVLTAQGGHEALALLKSCRPRAILLDVKMRGMLGTEILRKAKELDPTVAVIMVTGVSDEGLEEECRALGAAQFLHKPVRIDELAGVLLALHDAA